MKRLIAGFTVAFVLAAALAEGQGSLSSQVLRLLTRDNTWSGDNIYTHDKGVTLQDGSAPTSTTNKLYNIGGGLYFNGFPIATSASNGTVTSVALSMPAIFSVSGSPVTMAGTLTASLATQTANRVFAGPTSGLAAAPTFRLLVADDIPDLSATYATANNVVNFTNKTGNISQWTNDAGYLTSVGTITSLGTVTVGTWNADVIAGQYGGTGVANTGKTITLGGNLTTSGASALTLTTTGATNVTLPTSGTLLTNSVTTLSSLTSIGTIGTGTWQGTAIGVAYGGTNIASYAVGDLLYASGATTLAKLADVATGNVLISGGVTTAPAWGKVGLTTHVTGTLAHGNGGIDITTVTDDTTLVANGTAWQAKALASGVLSYDTATNAFSVPTTFILGTGAPTPSVNNILLRSTVNALLEVMEGNAADRADLIVRRLAMGNDADLTFADGLTTIFDLESAYTASLASQPVEQIRNIITLNPPADATQYVEALTNYIITAGSKNFAALYGADLQSSPGGSGTVTLNVGAFLGATATGTGTVTDNWAAEIIAGGADTVTLTTNIGLRFDTPTLGLATTNHYGIYMDDQTVAGSTIDYAFFYNAPSSKEVIIQADGQVLIGALKTTGSAATKKVVCVDTSTGQLYASTSDTACAS